jgi:type IV secretory pathway VirB4 component
MSSTPAYSRLLPSRLRRASTDQTPSASTDTGMPAPASVHVDPSHVRMGDGYAATLAVTGYPAEVGPAWLDALLTYPARIDVAVHIEPVAPELAAPMLKRQRARLESTRRLDAERGKLGDPVVEATAADAADLAERIARGAAKLFRVGIYLTVHARTIADLEQAIAGVRAAAASVLLEVAPATWRHHHGYSTTLPLGADRLGMTRILDTAALAAAFPFASTGLPAPTPGEQPSTSEVLYGVYTTSTGVLMWDRWAQDNHNMVVLARSGAGKSFFVKLDVLRNLYQGVAVAVIDPEDEYADLTRHMGGTLIQFGRPGVRINPLALPAGDRRPDALQRRALVMHTTISVMLGAIPPPEQQAALDRAIPATYLRAGITHDPATWQQPAPTLGDLAATLQAQDDPAGRELATRLHPWVDGSFANLFNGPTQLVPDEQTPRSSTQPSTGQPRSGAPLTVWSLRHIPDEVRTVATFLALDAIWREIDMPDTHNSDDPSVSARQRRLVVVDEAWLLLRDGEGAKFLFRMAKAARKRAAGLTVVTQDAADVLASDLGMAVVSNAATQILMRQATQAIDAVRHAFALTAGEARMLLNAPQGDALLVAGTSRVAFHAVGSPDEAAVARSGIGDTL